MSQTSITHQDLLKKENERLQKELKYWKDFKKNLNVFEYPNNNPDNTFDITNIDLDNTLYPENMDWSYDKPSVPHTVVYIFNKQVNDSMNL